MLVQPRHRSPHGSEVTGTKALREHPSFHPAQKRTRPRLRHARDLDLDRQLTLVRPHRLGESQIRVAAQRDKPVQVRCDGFRCLVARLVNPQGTVIKAPGSIQTQPFSAWLFVYREVLRKDLEGLIDAICAEKPPRF
jgi:hypothetical protein